MAEPIKDVTVIVATKGRPRETSALLDLLNKQTRGPQRVLVVAASAEDLAFPRQRTDDRFDVVSWVATHSGLTMQRNEAVRWLRDRALLGAGSLVVFFDDDFRPAADWIACCATLFETIPDLVGTTGRILADGISGVALTEEEASAFLSGAKPPCPHWATGERRPTTSVYGCNMAFAGRVLAVCLFDESLPLYAWQEDRDMTGQARRIGHVIFSPECRGVHLGAKGARTSGVRLGYSQIANIVYLARKGTIERSIAARFLLSSLAANMARSIYTTRDVDHFGRLKGNFIALADLAQGRCEPRKILDLH